MTIITFISLVPVVIILTLFLMAAMLESRDIIAFATCLLVVYLIIIVIFQAGATWHEVYIKENFNLTPKIQVLKP